MNTTMKKLTIAFATFMIITTGCTTIKKQTQQTKVESYMEDK